jgi:hypothetical protein
LFSSRQTCSNQDDDKHSQPVADIHQACPFPSTYACNRGESSNRRSFSLGQSYSSILLIVMFHPNQFIDVIATTFCLIKNFFLNVI